MFDGKLISAAQYPPKLPLDLIDLQFCFKSFKFSFILSLLPVLDIQSYDWFSLGSSGAITEEDFPVFAGEFELN